MHLQDELIAAQTIRLQELTPASELYSNNSEISTHTGSLGREFNLDFNCHSPAPAQSDVPDLLDQIVSPNVADAQAQR